MITSFTRRSFDMRILTVITLLSFTFANCGKDAETEVKVDKVEPASGRHSTLVAVTGSGFSSTAEENIVMFNGKKATVQSASSTLLQVVVPKSAGTGPVTVERAGKKGTGPLFDFLWSTTVTTLAGSGTPGYADGNAGVAQFTRPYGLDVDAAGNVYVADSRNNRIRKVTPAGQVSTVAGSGLMATQNGPANTAAFDTPMDVALDPFGNIYVAEFYSVRKISPNGIVTTVADTNPINPTMTPGGLISDKSGNIFVADRWNAAIWKITPTGLLTLFAGGPHPGFINGTGTTAKFSAPFSVACDKEGNFYVTDNVNNAIRKMTPSAQVTTFAGGGGAGWAFADGTGTAARFASPADIAVDVDGNIYVADEINNRIRKITPAGVVTTIAGTGERGYQEGDPATAKFSNPYGVAVDSKGTVYVGDNNRIRKIVSE